MADSLLSQLQRTQEDVAYGDGSTPDTVQDISRLKHREMLLVDPASSVDIKDSLCLALQSPHSPLSQMVVEILSF